jgi:cytochrome c oxidase subunit IV
VNRAAAQSTTAYLATFAALAALTALTVGVARLDLGGANSVVALAIAAIKAALVLLFFMHVRGSSPLIRATIAVACLWLAILFGFTLLEFTTRVRHQRPALVGVAETALPSRRL